MIGRREFAVAGLSIGATAALANKASAQAANRSAHAMPDEMDLACAKACSDCQRACDACSTHCAHQVHAGKKEHMTSLMTCQDCADFCAAAAQIVARGGPFAAEICKSCAVACAACGEACEKFPDDEHMKRCAEECRKCEKACREMVTRSGQARR